MKFLLTYLLTYFEVGPLYFALLSAVCRSCLMRTVCDERRETRGEPQDVSCLSAMTSTSQERAGLLHGAQASMSVSDRKILDQLPPMPTPDRDAMCWESVARAQVSNERLPRPAQHPVANTHAREMHCWRLAGT